MYDLTKANEIFEKMSTDDKVNRVFEIFRDKMPEEFCNLMYIMEYGCHIVTKKLYDHAVSLLVWAKDKGKGEKWSVEKVVELANIDFSEVKYYEYDLAYVMNMLYSDYCDIFTDSSYYLKMAKAYLEDPDYMGKADERAYHNAMKRIKYFENK